MISCSKCGHENRPGTFACDNCAWVLDNGTETIRVSEEQRQKINTAYLANQTSYSLTELPPQALQLFIESTRKAITLLPSDKGYLIGRYNTTSSFLNIDMSPHNAEEMGISRRHALVYQSGEDWIVEDLGSTNGTRINEYRLRTQEPCVVQNGDYIQFGLLTMQIQIG
jgi:hypothetical protein